VHLCRQFGISRKTGYKRLHRFQAWGFEGLGDVSRAPHQHPNQVGLGVAELLVEAKRAHLTWGPRKLIPWLRERHPEVVWPAPSTAGTILERAGLVRRRRRGRHAAPWGQPFAEATAPNDVWCLDFKGWFRTGDGRRCDPLTVADATSRYLLVCQGLQQPRGPQVRQVLERAFREYGLPRAIRTDNGPPFASTGLGGLSRLGVWWTKLGIVPERITPGHPEQNGRLERLHRTLKAETASPPQATQRAQQRVFDLFRKQYNEERPHEALGQRPPARCYQPSVRPYPARTPELEYPAGGTVRRVRSNGEIKWQGRLVYLSGAMQGELVGLVPQDDRFWTIQLGRVQIGLLDAHGGNVLHIPTQLLPMCPV
jgi:transposase InsO family protein